jgi:hypothetical protein
LIGMTHRASTIAVLIVAALSAVLSGCSTLVPFTHEIRSQNDLTPEELSQLQFYVSHEVTLRREVNSKGRVIRDGELQLRAGKQIEEVVIEDQTPGVAVSVNPASIKVSFQEGSALTFALQTGLPEPQPLRQHDAGGFAEPPDAFPGERAIHHHEEEPVELLGSYFLDTDVSSTLVSFQGQIWEAVENSYRAHLMIDSESLEEVTESRSVLGGRRIGKAQRPVHEASKLRFIRL